MTVARRTRTCDASSEKFTTADAHTVAHFAISQGLAGVHYWSYDRDVDCAAGSASPTCNSMGSGYSGPHGFLKRSANSKKFSRSSQVILTAGWA